MTDNLVRNSDGAVLEGIVLDLEEAAYHRHPALSSTGARKLLTAPREFQYAQTHPAPYKDAFNLGHAVHSKVLGVGAPTVAIPSKVLATNGAASTTAAKEFMEKARAEGKTPVKQALADEISEMCEAVLSHPDARPLFEQEGNAESSVFSIDPETGVQVRARFDFLPSFIQDDPWAVDLKTSAKRADAETFAKTIADLGYDVQQEHYLHAYALAGGDPTLRMKFVVVETNAPYLVAVHELSFEFAEIGAARAKRARQLFAQWSASKQEVWDGYPTDALPLQPPLWHIYQNQELLR